LASASSGYNDLCHGIVGSTNGLGVLSSTKIGRLIATFDPLLLLMLAVRVGKRACGLVISSGKNRLWLDFAPSGLK
jgi:hypothetical protein